MISVCMATYNGEKFLRQQLDSIICQLNQNDEIIISDNGSSDNTKEIIKSYNDSRIKYYDYITDGNYSAPKIPGIMQDFQQRQVLQLQRRLFHVFLLSRYKNGF